MKRLHSQVWVTMAVVGLGMSWLSAPVQAALPPDPDNAALLYYQAFLTLADLDKAAMDHIAEVAGGDVSPDEKVREDIGKCRAAIGFAEAARPLKVCNWGFRYSQGFEALMPQLAQSRFLARVLIADARIRAADGDYRMALDRCLMVNSFARHVGDDTLVAYLVSVAVRRMGYQCMEDLIGRAAGDAELLQWLKNELATLENDPPFPITALKTEREITLDTLTMANIEKLVKALAGSDEGNSAKIAAEANEQTLAKARQEYSDYMSSALTVLRAAVPYEQAHQRLSQLAKRSDANDATSKAVVNALTPALVRVLTVKTTQQAHANAAQAAVEICLHRARTGKLPDKLPSGLPKDPFSDRDFQYERTDNGFLLRCQGKDLDKGVILEFKFAVK